MNLIKNIQYVIKKENQDNNFRWKNIQISLVGIFKKKKSPLEFI